MDDVRPPSAIRIGIWGTSGSGKTTFLAALPVAAWNGRNGTWGVSTTSQEAAVYLNHVVQQLTVEQRCPVATLVMQPISWTFRGRPARRGVLARLGVGRSEVDFTLELYDPPGAFYENGHVDPELIQSLSTTRGLLYLIDPTVGAANDQTFRGFFDALTQLNTRMAENGQLYHGKLPHFVAVCVTKFDDERLFRRLARETDFLVQDKDGERLPRIRPGKSKEYFDFVCDRMLGAQAALVRRALTAHFHPDRIEYFATSAVGFRLNSRREFDFADFANVRMAGGVATIRDTPRPVNVLEPLLFLEERIRSERR
jgi:hypothetical protein